MVLGSKVEGLTYPKSMYYSTSPYGFFYINHALAMPPRLWTEEDDKWLASLYGLTFEKKVRPEGLDENAAWDEYIRRVEAYLKKGFPVQTFFGWTPKDEAEKRGEIVTPSGMRAYWWEGLTKQNRPDTHSFVIVGMDRSKNQVQHEYSDGRLVRNREILHTSTDVPAKEDGASSIRSQIRHDRIR